MIIIIVKLEEKQEEYMLIFDQHIEMNEKNNI
jgi:hypothetical protein